MTTLASASTRELLALDATGPLVRLDRHPLWEAVLEGTLAAERLGEVALTFYPSLAGTARYLFSSKVSTLRLDDGKAVFRELYAALTVSGADADRGWRQLALAVGAPSEQLDEILASPPPEVSDYVALARGFGHRSAHEAVGAAWGVERQLPGLWGRVADALARHYRVAEPALRYVRYQGTVADEVARRITELADAISTTRGRPTKPAGPRASAAWAWKSIGDRLAPA